MKAEPPRLPATAPMRREAAYFPAAQSRLFPMRREAAYFNVLR